MKFKIVIITISVFCSAYIKSYSQYFDSVHVYVLHLKSQYRIKIDKDVIKNEVEPIVLTCKYEVNSIYSMLNDSVRNQRVRKLESNHLDIRLSFEFFKENKVTQIVGVTSQNTMFIDYILYTYDKRSLKYLNKYIPQFSDKIDIE